MELPPKKIHVILVLLTIFLLLFLQNQSSSSLPIHIEQSLSLSLPNDVLDNLEWQTIEFHKLEHLLTADEWHSIHYHHRNTSLQSVCVDESAIGGPCCLGSWSAGGEQKWNPPKCFGDRNGFNRIPKKTRKFHHVLDILRMMERKKKRVWGFIGDSLHFQFTLAFACSHSRQGAVRRDAVEFQVHTNHWKVGTAYNFSYSVNFEEIRQRIHFYRAYTPLPDLSDVKRIIEISDLVIMNFGLHWLLPDKLAFENAISGIFRLLISASDRKLFVWRENTAQSFLSEGGEFDHSFSKSLNISEQVFEKLKTDCDTVKWKPVFTERVPKNWRDAIVRKAANDLGIFILDFAIIQHKSLEEIKKLWHNAPASIIWLPLFDYSTELNALRPFYVGENEHNCDRTHICYSPLIWEPVFENLYNLLLIAQKF